LEKASAKFDIIFADPPYDIDISQLNQILSLVFENQLLKKEGLLILEHSKLIDLSGEQHFNEARKYGGNVFSFFK
jgi:16S rRNA G966 N2-methylase RsmD